MLKEGDRFLDIGAGWGGLLIFAAEHYGVRAQGITLSKNQHAHVNKLIAERGLAGRVRMDLLDYRHLDESEPYDKIASIGMFEHVGRAQLGEYFAKIRRLLKPGGLLLNHGITAGGTHNHQLGSGLGDFIEKYIFPGGELEHVSHVLEQDQRRGPGSGRRREPAAALREDALGLERRARGPARHGADADHRYRAARLSPLSGGQRDVLRARLAFAAPDAVRAAQRRSGGRADARRTIGVSASTAATCTRSAESPPVTMYRFTSKADGDLLMMAPVGDQLLRIIGREPAPQGIIEIAAIPAAIAALEQAIAAAERQRKRRPRGRDDDDDAAGRRRRRRWASAPGRCSR